MNNAHRLPRLIAFTLMTLSPLLSLHAMELRFLNVEGQEHSLKFTNKGETVAITADENTLSPAYQFDDTAPLVLFKEVVKEGKTVRVTAATLAVPAELTHALIILSASDKALTTYSGVWIDDSPVTRPAGTILLLNRSRYSLSFKLDAEEFTLESKGVHQMPFSQDINRIVVQADAKIADKWERIFGNPLPVRAGVRVLLLLRDGRPQIGSKTNLVDMLSFYDRPPVQPEAPHSSTQ
ncbi:hypothetical protein [Rariglobus hedericola]|uniref:Uncharacterized protein n=2 Tax=Rariglobus hedericola TaxID=2597822 RepID=A0A556QSQ0_9BACT|nr:hypothetical protein [Rariglobus hedericola]TSJ79664.1 hypothetical protein FPL22_10365 [Rariglobus hedericola]